MAQNWGNTSKLWKIHPLLNAFLIREIAMWQCHCTSWWNFPILANSSGSVGNAWGQQVQISSKHRFRGLSLGLFIPNNSYRVTLYKHFIFSVFLYICLYLLMSVCVCVCARVFASFWVLQIQPKNSSQSLRVIYICCSFPVYELATSLNWAPLPCTYLLQPSIWHSR